MGYPRDLSQSRVLHNWRPTRGPSCHSIWTLWSQEILILPGGGQMPPQLVAIVVPFVRRMWTTLLLRKTRRLRCQDISPPASSSYAFHHVPGMWIAFGTWWTAFDSNIHFDNWQRGFVIRTFGTAVRFYSIQRLTITTGLRVASLEARAISVPSSGSFSVVLEATGCLFRQLHLQLINVGAVGWLKNGQTELEAAHSEYSRP
ncbi:GM12719 [Drosophila sechellia]|uniref:GM12719 n=1 Tax=Drosophila sechellia TaxID=7238 RepID=B4I163_DROSE|nr:GM12719 [Drosophila sechellia]